MATDMALPLYPPKGKFLHRTALSACIGFQRSRHVDPTKPDDRFSSLKENGKAKKQVTFADQKGLSLTKVKVFSEFNDPILIPLNSEMALSTPSQEDKMMLDFAPPSSDYVHFRQMLDRNFVCLERCMLSDKAVVGTIKVKNLSFEKHVKLRVTFDSWKTYVDVDCAYMEETYPSAYSDTFSFELSLPQKLQPQQCVQFAVCYEVDGSEYWDSNHGDNYRVIWSSMKRSCPNGRGRYTDSYDYGIHFDPYGSPTCSHGIFPDWPSYSRYENIGPYY
ncbi:protein phosphatase 1 regulatory subunit 3B isoform X1 [Solea solea]|uniref:protein phosphatase 1 regulatory subunit 3B isoform X1 n=1 Tax=Solea solea TaxID=90069 RepID=UPI00272ADFC2|nr:protein phosphatase 1 regulatory subunit 3B isoform X1 [Solea solea]